MTRKNPDKALRDFYAEGKCALEERKRIKRHHERIRGSLANQGAKTASQKNRLLEARLFARLYNEKQLDELCKLGQHGGQPLTKSHVLQLIRVEAKGGKRKRLAERCAHEEWTVRKLEREVAQIGPRGRYSGRPLGPPHSVDEALAITERLLRSSVRWVNVLTPTESKVEKKQITLDNLSESIQNKLLAISGEAKKLDEHCAKVRRRSKERSPKSKKRRRRQS